MRDSYGGGESYPADLTHLLLDPPTTSTLVVHVVASLDRALYDDYLCLVASNKQQIQWEVKETTGKQGNGQLLSGRRFVQNIAPPSLSRDRSIKEQTNIAESVIGLFLDHVYTVLAKNENQTIVTKNLVFLTIIGIIYQPQVVTNTKVPSLNNFRIEGY